MNSDMASRIENDKLIEDIRAELKVLREHRTLTIKLLRNYEETLSAMLRQAIEFRERQERDDQEAYVPAD